MKDLKNDETCTSPKGECDCLPRPVRMNYFHGQLISERDLRTEQNYFRDKLRHANRCLHGYGVLCGLTIEPVKPPEDCLPDDSIRRKESRREIARLDRVIEALKEAAATAESEAEKKELAEKTEAAAAEREKLRAELDTLNRDRTDWGKKESREGCEEDEDPILLVRVACGAAIDCDGNDLILPHAVTIDLAAMLRPSERDKLMSGEPQRIYLRICYQECGVEPTRPFALDECATTTACQDARVAEGVRLLVSLNPPSDELRCNSCCECCEDPCLLLAAIDAIADEPVEADDIDHSVRRRFGLYDPTVITGISWAHGATYTAATANGLLGTDDDTGGIEIAFSRPVHVDSLKLGVIDLLRITGGRGLSGVIAVMEGEYVGLPAEGMVDRVRYRDTTGETVQAKDRIMIVVRGPFILDCCCRPVEGLHSGGRVPVLPGEGDAAKAARAEEKKAGEVSDVCRHPPHGPMPWTSSGAGNFESWFWIAEK